MTINRSDLQRDSRYFIGLKNIDKDRLIKCIIQNLKYRKYEVNIFELENLFLIKQLINIPEPNFNPIFSIYDIDLFEKVNYYVSSVPFNSSLYYLYISPDESYFINTYGNKKVKSFLQAIDETIIFIGFLELNTETYHITDILYFNKKITEPLYKKSNMLSEIQEIYFLTEQSIIFPEYHKNIIKGSKELLQENSNILLVFTPEKIYYDLKVWSSNLELEDEIILQVVRKVKTNYYTLGYNNKNLENLSISFDNIKIKKSFIDSSNMSINDYVLFKFDYNIKTGKLSNDKLIPIKKINKVPKLTYEQTLIKLSLILNPVKESFFMNNKLEQTFVWSIPGKDKILKFVSDEQPLIDYEE